MSRALVLFVHEMKPARNLNIPLPPLQILDLLFARGRLPNTVGKHVRLAEHPPPVAGFPADQEIRLVEFLRESRVHGLLLFPTFGRIGVRRSVWFDEHVIGAVPVRTCLLPVFTRVERLGIVFHPLHGWMRPCFVVPGPTVYVGGLCRYRHGRLCQYVETVWVGRKVDIS
ncbi:uncharacterized protein HMPREF1120_03474 [Exophiala dermatitidis NIH/UT8656]|uniref:Uncharacterized protein n=1 Tax=Exophiala dermatitidis (strain ATCC 34100 / CBS 525.76 / NIH/UT8656) TaxID=858893 RepID=H6BX47_EXODN|nr:uncharacterized protein HMPREF1120_03474 [Exophiala dermatitidis NIH/UT8656]EHY55333.1 hypothetical protein HMPREF1120_03474 [Exophiala dermatitidis NIH/UT8656]